MIEETPQRREAESQRQEQEELKRQLRAEAFWQKEIEKRNNAQNAVQQFVGEDKYTMSKQKETSNNKLATLRKKIAHDIDETLGTHLEENKMPFKGLEAGVSKIVEKIVLNKGSTDINVSFLND